MKKYIHVRKSEYDLQIVVYTYEEVGKRVAYAPALELSGIGETDHEAIKDLSEMIQITFDYALTKGTLNAMLFDLGWGKVRANVS